MPGEPSAPAQDPGRGAWASHAAVLCWFGLLAIAISWPLILHLGTHIPGAGPGDNLTFLWNFWWFRQALADPAAPVFFTSYLFAPFGSSLVLHTHTALEAAAGATVLGSAPLPVAHNVVLLAGLFANGALTYTLAHHVTRRALPSALAGTIFAASPYVSIRLLGHFNLVHAWVLPLALLAWIRCVEKPGPWRAAAVAMAFAAAAYTDYYYAVFTALAAIVWWLAGRWDVQIRRVRPRKQTAVLLGGLMLALAAFIMAILVSGGFRVEVGSLRVSATSIRNPLAAIWLIGIIALLVHMRIAVRRQSHLAAHPRTEGRAVLAAIAGAVVFAIALAPLGAAAVELLASGDYAAPPQTWRSGPRGIDLLTLISGNPVNTIYGGATRAVYANAGIDVMEQSAWTGLVPLVVLVIGAARGAFRSAAARCWWILSVVFLIWAIGGHVVVAGTDTGVPMPQLLTRFVPILSNARMPGRAMVMVQLGVAILSAIAVSRLQWPRLVIAALMGLAVVEGTAPPIPLYRIPGAGPVEWALAAVDSDGVVLELPTGLRDGFGEIGHFDHRALVFQTYHGRPLAGGFVARLSPRIKGEYADVPALAALLHLSATQDPDAANLLPADLAEALRRLGITHVVVNTDALAIEMRDVLESRGLRFVTEDNGRELYSTSFS